MPRCAVSRDLKARIPYLAYVEGFKVKEIGQILGVKKSMIYQTLNYYRNYGVTYNPNAYMHHSRGHHRILDTVDVRFMKYTLDQDPCLYLDELQDLILMQRGIHVSVSTLLRHRLRAL
jgi:transposase